MCGDGCSWRCSCGGPNTPMIERAPARPVLVEFAAPRGYTVRTPSTEVRCLSFAEAKHVAKPISIGGSANIERDASASGHEGEQVCGRFVHGEQTFPII